MGIKFQNLSFNSMESSILEKTKVEMSSDKYGSQFERKSKTWFFTFLNEYVS